MPTYETYDDDAPKPEPKPQPPFPLMPAALQICSLLGAVYPHLDIVDDVVVTVFGEPALAETLRHTSLGAGFLFLSYYLCQFVMAMGQLRVEYLGALALIQACNFIALAIRAFHFPAAVRADPVAAAVTVASSVLVVLLLQGDQAARRQAALEKDAPVAQRAPSGRRLVAVGTQALWLVFLAFFLVPFAAPSGQRALPPGVWLTADYFNAAGVALSLAVAAARLWAGAAEWRANVGAKKAKKEE